MSTFCDPTLIAGPVAAEDSAAAQAFVPVSFDPVIGAVLSPTMVLAIAKRREEYRAALQAHDWDHEQSDDHSVYRRGVTERARLMIDAAALDPQFELWNEIAPPEYRRVYVTDGRRRGELNFGAWSLPVVGA